MDLSAFFEDNKDDVDFCLEEVYIDIQEQVARLIERENVSREELIKKLEKDEDFLENFLNGTENITLRNLMEICIELNARPEIFLQRAERHKAFAGVARYDEEEEMYQLEVTIDRALSSHEDTNEYISVHYREAIDFSSIVTVEAALRQQPGGTPKIGMAA